MPEFDISMYNERRYGKRITADDSKQALEIAKNMTTEEWGDPESTTNEEVYVFNLNGDEVEHEDI